MTDLPDLPERLDPATLPLRGSRLIEASAGTGKTWTIAALYLRLILGHGAAGQAPAKPLLPGEILVMTFTKAATRELSDRIRSRLIEAAACFRGSAEPAVGDGFLAQLLNDHLLGPARAVAAWRLAAAAEAMDDAAVHTIDAWCQRMLREHAFDSGSPFDEELLANTQAMLREAAHDYWRQQVYPLEGDTLERVMALWSGVDKLIAAVGSLVEKPLPAQAGHGSLQGCIDAVSAQRRQRVDALKEGWVERTAEMLGWLEPLWAAKDGPIDKRSLGEAHTRRWLGDLQTWANDPLADSLDLGRGAERLIPAGIVGACKPGRSVDPPACFAALQTLLADLAVLPEIDVAMRAHAAAGVTERLQQLKTRAGAYGFADQLMRLHDALDPAINGERAHRFRQRIVDRYPAALVDEFQDTSPVQLGIFDRLYRLDADDPERTLLLIGDPKQSIYGFRGADIQSYLQARRATTGRHHVLGTNYRASEALVGAVNHLFLAAEVRPGRGAFLFRDVSPALASGDADAAVSDADAAASDTDVDVYMDTDTDTDANADADADADANAAGLPFVAVAAAGRLEQAVTSAGPLPAMAFCLDAELQPKERSQEAFAAHCAERIVTLLNDAGCGFRRPGQPLQVLQPADIAVLVRDRREAAAMRRALRQRGVASVYLSEKDTVFQTDEAHDLLRLMRSVAAPRDVPLARTALATALIGANLAELIALATDDLLFDARCDLLRQLQITWQTQGVLAMVRAALHGFDLPARWLAGEGGLGGERRLTDVLHLAELLQAASTRLDGEAALLAWLAGQIEAAAEGQAADDAQLLRLESDAGLVQVVTVWKSKGLEYPLVFLPFAAHFRAVEHRNTNHVFLPDASGQRVLSLVPTDEQLAAADLDRQREDLRLLYVALTRARHAVWVGASMLGRGGSGPCTWPQSAIGSLVSGSSSGTPETFADQVRALAGTGADIEVVVLPPAAEAPPLPVTRLRRRAALPPLAPPLPYAANFERQWSIGSYSALVRDVARAPSPSSGDLSLPTSLPLRRDDEPETPADRLGAGAPLADWTDLTMANATPADAPWHRFPRGALAGNFLHGLLEGLAVDGFALDDSAALQEGVVRQCERQGWGRHAADVVDWLRRLCATPLPVPGVPLAALRTTVPEMEFWLPSNGLDARAVDTLCRQHLLPGEPRPPLPTRVLRGMLMGFADLVFEHEGRFWVLDYKSNALGRADADYTPAAMAGAMLAHRYDVQAALYLLALHRLLRTRLGPAYVPSEHLGGAVYLFLRGVNSAERGCFHVAPPLGLTDSLDALVDGASGASVDASIGGSVEASIEASVGAPIDASVDEGEGTA